MNKDLEGKIILLTGGASGIGRECAIAYAREGATVAILDRSFEEAKGTAKELGNRSTAYHADVTDGAAIQTAITSVLKEFGRLDAVHNNASIVGPSSPARNHGRPVGRSAAHEFEVRFLDHEVCISSSCREQGRNSEHGEHGRIARTTRPCSLRCHQRRHDLADEGDGGRLRKISHQGERSMPCGRGAKPSRLKELNEYDATTHFRRTEHNLHADRRPSHWGSLLLAHLTNVSR
jgi:short chain dehydrogenase